MSNPRCPVCGKPAGANMIGDGRHAVFVTQVVGSWYCEDDDDDAHVAYWRDRSTRWVCPHDRAGTDPDTATYCPEKVRGGETP